MRTDFWVGDRIVRPSLSEIRLGMERVHLEPRSMEVLVALVERAGEVVPKQELIAAVWGDAFVSDEVLTHAIWDLRRAFGDHASDPEFIQTIPKRGYRLIAPVRAVDGEERENAAAPTAARPPLAARPLIWGLIGAALLAAIGVWLAPYDRAARSPAAAETSTPESRFALILEPTEPFPGTEELVRRLDTQLQSELAGLRSVELRQSQSCQPVASAERTFCLESTLLTGTELYAVTAALRDAQSQQLVYAPPPREPDGRTAVSRAAREIAEGVTTYLEVIRHRHFHDPDIKPWISLQHHDIRAIRDFLHGLPYIYRHEVGGRHLLASAITRDPQFVAPRVWRTPTLLREADNETLATHRADLEHLRVDATGFEKAMIGWILGLMDGDEAAQLRQLEVALELEPDNRPALLALAAAHDGLGDSQEAWRIFDRLLARQWHYPGLYPAAAQCALGLDRIEEARRALELGQRYPPVDPAGLALLALIAIYEGDAATASHHQRQLEQRLRELSPEVVDLDLAAAAEALAARAEREGRQRIAEQLRESAA